MRRELRVGDFVTVNDEWKALYHTKQKTICRMIGVIVKFKEEGIAIVNWVGFDTFEKLNVKFLRPLDSSEVYAVYEAGGVVPEIREFIDGYWNKARPRPTVWWKNRKELIMRIDALAGQIRVEPDALTEDPDTRIKLNKIGKAFEELAYCLRALEEPDFDVKEEPKWYESVMAYWKRKKKKKERSFGAENFCEGCPKLDICKRVFNKIADDLYKEFTLEEHRLISHVFTQCSLRRGLKC